MSFRNSERILSSTVTLLPSIPYFHLERPQQLIVTHAVINRRR